MKYTILGIVHGVEGFGLNLDIVQKFIISIKWRLPGLIRNYVIPQIINWDTITGSREEEALQMEKGLPNWIDHLPLKRKLIGLKHRIGSDIMFEFPGKTSNGMNWIEQEIFDLFEINLTSLIRKYGEDSNLMLIGHSWGGQKALRYCFDSTYRVHGLITLGSPITAVSGAFEDWGKLPQGLKFWLNIRAAGDWIGSHFKYHKSEQIRNFVEDFYISSWNPLKWTTIGAHTSYWNSEDTCNKIVNTIIKNFYN